MSWRQAIAVSAAAAILLAGVAMPVRVAVARGFLAAARDGKDDFVDANLRHLGAWRTHFAGQWRIGLIIDASRFDPPMVDAIRHMLQYAAAPTLVDADALHEVVVAWFDNAAALERFCAANGYVVIQAGKPGVAVLKRGEAR